ncbi:MAG: hypothetical protein ACE5GB_03170 [Acidimicrobiales bacterium]
MPRTATRTTLATLTAAALLAAGCTYRLSNDQATWGCGAFRYEVNADGAGPEQLTAVHAAVQRYGAAVGREVVFVGTTEERWSTGSRAADDPVLIEWFWPDDPGQPAALGFAEPFIREGAYVGGHLYLHPSLGDGAAGIVERLTLHELGHIGGLDEVDAQDELMNPNLPVDDWGQGELVGLGLTHDRCVAQ